MARTVTEIQVDLETAYASRRAALSAESYSLDTGQGKQSVGRNLSEINNTIRTLESELEDATGSSGNYYATMERN